MGDRRHYNGGKWTQDASTITLERQFWSGCNGKMRYTSKRQARGGRRATLKARGGVEPGDKWLEAYKCPHCHGWHNGHRPRPPARES